MKVHNENNPTKLIWLTGGAISLLLHTGLMWHLNQNNKPSQISHDLPQASSIKLVMSAAAPKAAITPPIPPLQPTEPLTSTTKEPPIEQELKPIAEHKPKPKPVQSEPAVEPQHFDKRLPIDDKKEIKNDTPQPASEAFQERLATKPALKSNAALRDEHLSELVKRIDHNKQYPRRAQKRNIEGQVSFILHLDSQGQLQNFEWKKGNRLFYKSTLEAVRKSLPLPLPSGLNTMKYSLGLSYRLL